ncbi:putative immunity protein [Vibrio cyclitrophicus]
MNISVELLIANGAEKKGIQRLNQIIGQQELSVTEFVNKAHLKPYDYEYLIPYVLRNGVKIKDIVRFAINCAILVLPIFERYRPFDQRPREAIQAAKTYLNQTNDKQRDVTASLAIYRATLAIRASNTAFDEKRFEESAAAVVAAKTAIFIWSSKQQFSINMHTLFGVIEATSIVNSLADECMKELFLRVLDKETECAS